MTVDTVRPESSDCAKGHPQSLRLRPAGLPALPTSGREQAGTPAATLRSARSDALSFLHSRRVGDNAPYLRFARLLDSLFHLPPSTSHVPHSSRLLSTLLATLLVLAASTHAATNYWNGAGTGWDSTGNWSTASGAATPNPSNVPGLYDDVIFNISTLNSAQTVNLNTNQAARTLVFTNTGTTVLLGNGGAGYTLTNGWGGVTIAAGAGGVTLGDGTPGNNVLMNLVSGNRAWANNSANDFTVNNTTSTFIRANGSTLAFNRAGAGGFNMTTTVLPNTNGIAGPWASWGTGTNTQYAYNNVGTITGFTGTAAATGANLVDTTGTTNFDLAAGGGTVPVAVSLNTIRYTGGAGTTTPTGSFSLNGILNAGTGTWIVGTDINGAVYTYTIGSTRELVVNTANSDIYLGAQIQNNAGGASSLTKTGSGTLRLGNNQAGLLNTFSGGVTLNAGTLWLYGGNTPLQLLGTGPLIINGGALNATTYTLAYATPQNWNGDFTFTGANGNLTFSAGTVTLGDNRTVTVNANTLTIGGTITDNGSGYSLTKNGNGTLALSGTTAYTGATTISAGTLSLSGINTGNGGFILNAGQLNVNSATALGTGTLVIKGGTIIDNTSALAVAVSTAPPMSWEGDFDFKTTNAGTPALNLGTGTITLNGPPGSRTIREYKNAASSLNNPITMGGTIKDGTATGLTINTDFNLQYGFFILAGTNIYSGPTTLNPRAAYNLLVRADDGVGLPVNSLLTLSAAVLETGTNLVRTGGTSPGNMQITGGNSGFSAYGAPVQVAFGTLGSPSNLTWGVAPFSPGTFFLNESTANNALDFRNAVNLQNAARTVQVNAGSAYPATMSGVLSSSGGSGGLTKAGVGTLILSGTNTFAGQLIVSAGTVSVPMINSNSLAGPLGNSALSVSIAGGATLEYTGATAVSDKKFTLATSGSASTFQIDSASTTQTLSGVIDGSGQLAKAGPGTLIFAATNTYTGNTICNAGTLILSGLNAATNETVVNGGTILLASTSVISNSTLVCNNGGALSFGGLTNVVVGAFRGNIGAPLLNDSAVGVALTIGGNNQNTLFGGSLSGGGSLIKAGTGMLTLSGANTYSGGTTISNGTILVRNAAALPYYTNAIIAVGTGGTLAVNAGLPSPAEWSSAELAGLLANANLTFAAGGYFGVDTGSGNFTYGMAITNANMGLTKFGANALTLNGAAVHTFAGGLAINGGTNLLDFANLAMPSDLINSSNTLTLGPGTLQILGKSAGTTSQTFSNMTQTAGGGQLLINPNGGGGTTLILGEMVTTNAGGSLLVGTAAGAGGGSVTIATASAADGTGIYGGRVLFTPDGGSSVDWATTVSGGSPYAASAYSAYETSEANWTNQVTTTNVSLTSAPSITLNDTTMNSLKLGGGIYSLTINAGQTLTLASGGLLAAGGAAPTITGGTLKGASGKDLIVHQYSSGTLAIGSAIANNGTATALTKSGPGTLALSGVNTFTGGIFVNGGKLSFTGSSALNAANNQITLNGGTLQYTGGSGGVSFSQTITVGPNGGTYIAGGWAGGWGDITGPGNFVYYGSTDERFSRTAGYSLSGDFVVMQNGGGLFMGSFPNATIDIETASGITRGNNYQTYPVFGGLKGFGPLTLSNFGTILYIGGNNRDTVYTGVIGGATPWAKIGTGTLTMTNNANAFTGPLAIQSGALAVGTINSNNAAGPLGQSTNPVTMGYAGGVGGTLRLIGTSVSYSSNKRFTMAPGGIGVFQIDSAGTTQTISGAIDGEGGLAKTGPGGLIISGANTFTGPLTISAGTLGGFCGSSAGALTNRNSGTLSPGADSVGAFTNGGSAVLEAGSTLRIELGGFTNDLLAVGGTASLGGALTIVTNAPLLSVSYEIVRSIGALTGRFAVTNGLPPGFDVVYEANRVLLVQPPIPVIQVLGTNNVLIVNGDVSPGIADGTDFAYGAPGVAVTNTFVITNFGTAELILTGMPTVAVSGHTNDFTVSQQPGLTNVAPAGTVSFSVVFTTPVDNDSRTCTVSIACNDAGQNPYTFALRGGPRNGTWTNDAAGYWSQKFNWKDESVAQQATYTAFFLTDITAARTVTNDMSNLSIGHLYFVDTAASHDWTLVGNQINMDNAGNGSTIMVSNRTATISCVITGAETLTKSGAGTLSLTAVNTYTGKTRVTGGTLTVAASTALGASPASLVADQVTLEGATLGGSVDSSSGNNRGVYLGPGGGTLTLGQWMGPFSGPGKLYIANGGEFRLNGGSPFGAVGAYDSSHSGDTVPLTTGLRVCRPLSLQNSTLDLTTAVPSDFYGNSYAVLGGLKGSQNWAVATASGGLFVGNNNRDTIYSGVLSGSGTPVIKIGTGTLALSGDNTYSGGTIVNGGTLIFQGKNTGTGSTMINTGKLVTVTGGSCSNSAVAVGNGATNVLQIASSGGIWTCSNMTYGAGTSWVEFDFGTNELSKTVAPLQVRSDLAFNGTVINVTVRGIVAIPAGVYPLIKYGGTITNGTPPTTPFSLPVGLQASLSNNVAGKSVDLVVTVGNEVKWGVGNGSWDVSTTMNWTNAGLGTLVTYLDGQLVQFDDVAAGPSPITVTLDTNVGPLAVVVSNAAMNYTITGRGSIGGTAALRKQGSGTMTIANTNTYSGGTVVSEGTLILSGGNNLSDTGAVAVLGGVLDVGAASDTIGGLTVSGGSITGTVGVLSAASCTVNNGAGEVSIGAILGGVGTLTKYGAGALTLSGACTYSGVTTLAGGTTRLDNAGNGGLGSGTLILGGGILEATNAARSVANNVVMMTNVTFAGLQSLTFITGSFTQNGGNLRLTNSIATGNVLALAGCVYLSETAGTGRILTLAGTGNTLVSGPVANFNGGGTAGGLTINGSGTNSLSGVNSYSGATTVSNGTLMGVSGGSCDNSDVKVAGGTLGISITNNTQQWSCKSLTHSAASALLFDFGVGAPSSALAPLKVNGDVTFTATPSVAVAGSSLALGAYPLMTWTGNRTGFAPTTATLPAPYSGIIVQDVPGKTLWIIVTTQKQPLTWKGFVDTTWDIAGTANWNDAAAAQTNYLEYVVGGTSMGDSVVFDDSSLTNLVALNTTVSPASISFNNTAKDYSIFGSGSIAGGAILTKTGAGTLTLATANTYGGGTAINAGTIAIGADNNLGAIGSAISFNGGTLGSGTGVFALTNRPVAVGSSGVAFTNTAGGNLTVDGGINGTGSLTKRGAGTLTLSNATSSLSGSIALGDGGTVVINGGARVATAASAITGARSNTVVVTGAGSVWTNGAGNITVGSSGNANGLVVSGGGRVYVNGGVDMATYSGGSTGHYVIVTGTNTELNATGTFMIWRMPGSYLSISRGAVVRAGSYSQSDSVGNGVTVDGAGSRFELTGQMNVAAKQAGPGTSHYLVITNGGVVKSTSGVIGNTGPEGYNNTAVVTGPDSAWTNTGALTVYGTYGNSLTVVNGARVVGSTSLSVGDGSGANYCSSRVSLAGGSLLEVGTSIRVGQAGSTNNIVTNRSSVLQFTSGSPTVVIGVGADNKVFMDSATLSYRNASGVDINANMGGGATVGAFNWTGTNTLRLDNSTATGTRTFGVTGDPRDYAALELFSRVTMAGGIAVDGGAGGSLLFSSAIVTNLPGVTISGRTSMTVLGTNSLTGPVSGGGTLVKLGAGTLSLNSTNAYTGDTVIEAGTLGINNPCLYVNRDVYLAAGAKCNLDFNGTNTIRCLYLGGQRFTTGLFGRDAAGGATWFAGAGILKVEPGTTFIVR